MEGPGRGEDTEVYIATPLILDMTVNVADFSREVGLAVRTISNPCLKGKKFFKTYRF